MLYKHYIPWIISGVLWLFPAFLVAQIEDPPGQPGQRWFSFSFDNDIFVGTDGGYTNGLYLSWYTVPSDERVRRDEWPWYYDLQAAMTDVVNSDKRVFTFNIGQTMITPSDISRNPPDSSDLPYAGLLYWQGSIASINDRSLEFANLLIGLVGPGSLAEDSQKLVHEATGSEEPQGWDYQLKDEPLLGLSYAKFLQYPYKQKKHLEFDIVSGLEGTLGNLITSVEGSAYLRIGKQLNTSWPTMSAVSSRAINPIAVTGGWFFYLGMSIQYAPWLLIYEGNLFRSSPSIAYEKVLDRISAGFAVSTQRWGFSFSYTDFGALRGDAAGRQKFGSLSILYRYE